MPFAKLGHHVCSKQVSVNGMLRHYSPPAASHSQRQANLCRLHVVVPSPSCDHYNLMARAVWKRRKASFVNITSLIFQRLFLADMTTVGCIHSDRPGHNEKPRHSEQARSWGWPTVPFASPFLSVGETCSQLLLAYCHCSLIAYSCLLV